MKCQCKRCGGCEEDGPNLLICGVCNNGWCVLDDRKQTNRMVKE